MTQAGNTETTNMKDAKIERDEATRKRLTETKLQMGNDLLGSIAIQFLMTQAVNNETAYMKTTKIEKSEAATRKHFCGDLKLQMRNDLVGSMAVQF